MEIIRIAIIGLIGSLLALTIKEVKGNFSAYISLGACVVLLFFLAGRLSDMIDRVKEIAGYVTIESEYIEILIKMLGITYIAEFSSSLCKDMGYGALAVQIENFSKLSLLTLSFPIIIKLLEIIGELA